jgi:hypothetical protein
MEKPGVIEPTGSWSGFEAMLAAYLEGDAGKARRCAGALLQHLKGLSTQPDVAETFTTTARSLLQLPAASYKPSGTGAAAVMSQFACALKNWEQGALDVAAADFRAFADTRLGSDDQWLSVYQGYARKYLADYAKLTAAAPAALPETPEECKKLIESSTELLGTLETRGRARFNVKAWQHAAGQQQKSLERAAAAAGTDGEGGQEAELKDVLGDVQPLLDDGKFAAAVEALKAAKLAAGEEGQRKAWVYLTEAAADFLSALEKGCLDKVLDVPMATQDGRKYPGIVGAGAGSARFLDGAEQISVPWVELSIESLTALHSALLRNEPSEAEKVRRHEAAIAYTWLAGDKARAGVAASRIDNAEFSERWNAAMKAIGQVAPVFQHRFPA